MEGKRESGSERSTDEAAGEWSASEITEEEEEGRRKKRGRERERERE